MSFKKDNGVCLRIKEGKSIMVPILIAVLLRKVRLHENYEIPFP